MVVGETSMGRTSGAAPQVNLYFWLPASIQAASWPALGQCS